MTLAVIDANIFIDLFDLGLLSLFFLLKLNFHTTKEVLLECRKALRHQLQHFIDQGKLTIQAIADHEVNAMKTMNFNRGLSEPDKSVLFVAHKENGMVVSGDKLVRKWCRQNQLEVHGILWVLDQMEQTKLLSTKEAISKLEALLEINFWLPVDAANELLEKWKSDRKNLTIQDTFL